MSKCKDLFRKLNFEKDMIVLCGTNRTRVGLNKDIRNKIKNYNLDMPYRGERVVCLKNNNERGISKGQLGTLIWITLLF